MTTTWACANHNNPDQWFPSPGDKPLHALDTCRTCPARQACARAALDLKPTHGIWAGINITDTPDPTSELHAIATGQPKPDTPTKTCRRGHPLSGPNSELHTTREGHRRCRACQRILQHQRRTGTRPQGTVKPITNHGTRAGYVTHKCRCDECRGWNRARLDRIEQRKKAS